MIKIKVLRNMIRCLSCGDIIESTYGHDYKVCRCKKVSVDGGRDYLKIFQRIYLQLNRMKNCPSGSEMEG